MQGRMRVQILRHLCMFHEFDTNRESVTTTIADYPPGSYAVVLQRGSDLSTARFVKGE
jgi:hypothetical protein